MLQLALIRYSSRLYPSDEPLIPQLLRFRAIESYNMCHNIVGNVSVVEVKEYTQGIRKVLITDIHTKFWKVVICCNIIFYSMTFVTIFVYSSSHSFIHSFIHSFTRSHCYSTDITPSQNVPPAKSNACFHPNTMASLMRAQAAFHLDGTSSSTVHTPPAAPARGDSLQASPCLL